MKKHRVRALCTAASLLISLSGCQNSAPLQKERYYIFATPLADHAIWTRAREGFFDACEELGVHGDWLGPNIIDVDQMETVIETGILQKADGIITQGVVDHEVLSLAREARIPVVLVDSDMRPVDRLCFIGKDFHRQAVLFLEDIEKRVGRDTFLNIAIQAANLDFRIAQDQIEQIRQVFAAHPGGFQITSSPSPCPMKSAPARNGKRSSRTARTSTSPSILPGNRPAAATMPPLPWGWKTAC